jgi:hypothetical protein
MRAKEENRIREKPSSGLRQNLPLEVLELDLSIHSLLFEARMAFIFTGCRTPGPEVRESVDHWEVWILPLRVSSGRELPSVCTHMLRTVVRSAVADASEPRVSKEIQVASR